jgi:hypothetical protein
MCMPIASHHCMVVPISEITSAKRLRSTTLCNCALHHGCAAPCVDGHVMLLQGCSDCSRHHRRGGGGNRRQQRRRRRWQDPQQGQGPRVCGHAVTSAAPARQPQWCVASAPLALQTLGAARSCAGAWVAALCILRQQLQGLSGAFRVNCRGAVLLQPSCIRECCLQQTQQRNLSLVSPGGNLDSYTAGIPHSASPAARRRGAAVSRSLSAMPQGGAVAAPQGGSAAAESAEQAVASMLQRVASRK